MFFSRIGGKPLTSWRASAVCPTAGGLSLHRRFLLRLRRQPQRQTPNRPLLFHNRLLPLRQRQQHLGACQIPLQRPVLQHLGEPLRIPSQPPVRRPSQPFSPIRDRRFSPPRTCPSLFPGCAACCLHRVPGFRNSAAGFPARRAFHFLCRQTQLRFSHRSAISGQRSTDIPARRIGESSNPASESLPKIASKTALSEASCISPNNAGAFSSPLRTRAAEMAQTRSGRPNRPLFHSCQFASSNPTLPQTHHIICKHLSPPVPSPSVPNL